MIFFFLIRNKRFIDNGINYKELQRGGQAVLRQNERSQNKAIVARNRKKQRPKKSTVTKLYPNPAINVIKDHNCVINFSSHSCKFQEHPSGRTISSATESGGLYFLDDGSYLPKLSSHNCYESVFSSSDSDIFLWHYRLGHPSFHYLK